jgi:hypothetical protein
LFLIDEELDPLAVFLKGALFDVYLIHAGCER